MERTRRGGAVIGFGLFGLPGLVFALIIEFGRNAAFIDAPFSAWMLLAALPGLIGAAIGAWLKGPESRLAVAMPLIPALGIGLLGLSDGIRPLPELKLLVVGIDGGTWTEIDPMRERGELPTLNRLVEQGAHGTMHATGPLFSPLLWTSMAAGKDHDSHGVRGFRTHANDARVPMFYDIAEHEGLSIGLYKWLVTWPPRTLKHGGFIVPGWLAPSPETAPMDLSFVKELELSSRVERKAVALHRPTWRLGLAGLWNGMRFSTLRDAAVLAVWGKFANPDGDARFYYGNLLRARIDRDVCVFAMQAHRPALATFTYYTTDGFGHRYWQYHEPEKFENVDPTKLDLYGQAIPEAYRQADAITGELMRLLPADGRLVVVSDHGFKAMDAAGVRVAPKTEALRMLLEHEVGKVDLVRIGARITVLLGEPDREAQRAKIDALMPTLLRHDGSRLFRWAVNPDDDGEVVVDMLTTEIGADELDDPIGGGTMRDFVSTVEDYSGDHAPEGIFAAYGPGVEPGKHVDVMLLDVAPISLAALGIAKGADMPGTVPPGLWSASGEVQSWDSVRDGLVWPVTDDSAVDTEMLEQLGYIEK